MARAKEQDRLAGVRALIIDDEEPIRRIADIALRRAGCEVETAGDGREGLQILLHGDFDVVVVDLKMNRMDGVAFLTEALKIWPWLGVVIVTGYAEDEAAERARALGVRHVLTKPFNLTDLQEKVEEEVRAKQQRIGKTAPVTLDRVQYELSLLRKLARSVIDSETLMDALRNLSTGLGQIMPADVIGVLSIEEEPALTLFLQKGVSPQFLEQLKEHIRESYEALSGIALPPEIRVDTEGAACGTAAPAALGGRFTVPIMSGGEVRGLMALASVEDAAYTETDMSLLYHAANHLSTVLLAFERMKQMAFRDGLTGLYNRRQLMDELRNIRQIARRQGFPVGMAILDIDHFKRVNDTYGHLAGDAVLRELSQLIRNVARASDAIGRYGGDEVVVLLPGAQEHDLNVFGRRVLQSVRSHVFCRGSHDIRLTVSIGLAAVSPVSGSDEEFLGHADAALYAAKRQGRDQLKVWSRDTVSPGADSDPGAEAAAAPPEAGKVMVVDDDPAVLSTLGHLIRARRYEVSLQTSAAEALAVLKTRPGEYGVVLVDLKLGEEDGLDLLGAMNTIDEDLVKIVVTGHATLDNAVASLQRGTFDFIEKPVRADHLFSVLAKALDHRLLRLENKRYQSHLEEMVEAKSQALSNALEEVKSAHRFSLEALATVLEAREYATGQHGQRVKQLALILGRELNLPSSELDVLVHGALLHDIGKIAIPDAVLLKAGPLNEEEWQTVRRHPTVGYEILKASPYLSAIAEVVYSHQERFDGSGYPRGLRAEEICLGARVFAVVDAYDAMRSDRPYRKRMSFDVSLSEIKRGRGTQFDPRMVDAFLRCLPELEALEKHYAGTAETGDAASPEPDASPAPARGEPGVAGASP